MSSHPALITPQCTNVPLPPTARGSPACTPAFQDKRRGPYSAAQLLKWHNKGFFGREFSCEHAGTRLWMPLWLVVGHYQASGTSAQDRCVFRGVQADVSSMRLPGCHLERQ